MKNKIILEYIWLDGYKTQNLRSKIKVIDSSMLKYDSENTIDIESIPVWNFDGSSTMQASGDDSECILKPCRIYKMIDSLIDSRLYILCEVMNTDMTPHKTNTRFKLSKNKDKGNDFWWGFEQEYFITSKNGIPVGFPADGYPEPQGEYYCGVGNKNVKLRKLATNHMYECLYLGIDITGINAEVAIGQWEYQCFAKDTLKACDDLWMSRYLLYKLSEDINVNIVLDPKPVKGNWNGSGCHTNFSDKMMREDNNPRYYKSILSSMRELHKDHIAVYGEDNGNRLTGEHETQHIDKFSSGIGDRGSSIRIPIATVKNNWNGYLEDRRPSSNCDPYLVADRIIKTVCN